MAQINVNIRIDETLKNEFEQVCSEMGLTMTAAFTIFAKAVTRKRAIPFEVSAVKPPQDITLPGFVFGSTFVRNKG